MPKIKVKGKVKHFSYTKKGKEAAEEAIEEGGKVLNRKKKINTYGMKYLKG